MHISIAAEPLFHIWGLTVTNSLLASFVTTIFLTVFAIFMSLNIKSVPTRIQAVVEEFFMFIMDLTEKSIDAKFTKKFVPLVITLFFFILMSNWLGLLPGFGSLILEKVEDGHQEFVPLLRGATADLNTTLALALISFFAIQFFGIAQSKLSYFKKFINFTTPINFFVGVLELISEVAKIISFSFRLFGNVFAGEVLLAVIISLVPLLAPLPFFGLEVFIGFIQALVFAMLTLIFIQLAMSHHVEAAGEVGAKDRIKSH